MNRGITLAASVAIALGSMVYMGCEDRDEDGYDRTEPRYEDQNRTDQPSEGTMREDQGLTGPSTQPATQPATQPSGMER